MQQRRWRLKAQETWKQVQVRHPRQPRRLQSQRALGMTARKRAVRA